MKRRPVFLSLPLQGSILFSSFFHICADAPECSFVCLFCFVACLFCFCFCYLTKNRIWGFILASLFIYVLSTSLSKSMGHFLMEGSTLLYKNGLFLVFRTWSSHILNGWKGWKFITGWNAGRTLYCQDPNKTFAYYKLFLSPGEQLPIVPFYFLPVVFLVFHTLWS